MWWLFFFRHSPCTLLSHLRYQVNLCFSQLTPFFHIFSNIPQHLNFNLFIINQTKFLNVVSSLHWNGLYQEIFHCCNFPQMITRCVLSHTPQYASNMASNSLGHSNLKIIAVRTNLLVAVSAKTLRLFNIRYIIKGFVFFKLFLHSL
jgi:hypothetical protein